MEIWKLSDLKVKNAKPKEKAYRLSDGRGLYLVVTPSGGKLWRWSYEFNSKEKLLSYGQYPFLTLADARARHVDARKLRAEGRDPAADKQAFKLSEKAATMASSKPTFAEVAESWFEIWSKQKSKRYVDTVRYRLDGDILPALGTKPIDAIRAPDIVKLVTQIQDRDAVDLAKRALQKTKQIYRFAVASGWVDSSPAEQIRACDILESRDVKNFARISSEDLPQLLRDIELYHGNPLTRLAMKLMALTFLRTGSLIEAEWSEINFEAKRWTVPKEHMKGKKFPHIVPLARQTIELLELLHILSGESRYLFPGQGRNNKTMSNGTICKALEGMGYKGEMTGHGFRGVASTILHESKHQTGHEHEHIEAQLAHSKKNKVSGAYDHSKYIEPRTRMMEDWADYLELSLRSGKYSLMEPARALAG
jgi:integrase